MQELLVGIDVAKDSSSAQGTTTKEAGSLVFRNNPADYEITALVISNINKLSTSS